MMTTHSHPLGITLPITTDFKQVAQRFAQICPFEDKSEQIRRNTLAVCVVNSYLQLMDIPSAIAQGDSWNPMMQTMADVADLHLPTVGTLSCRVADVDSGICYVPPEAWDERMGYVAVAIDEAANEAMLLGFAPSVDAVAAGDMGRMPLERFDPIEGLIDEVARLQATAVVEPAAIASSAETRLKNSAVAAGQTALTQLGQWLDGVASAGWHATEALLNPAEMGFAFRTAGLASAETVADVSRAKLVDLGIQLDQAVRVALVMQVTQTSADTAAESFAESPVETTADAVAKTGRSNIVLQVRPLGDSPYLTENLVLTVLDEEGAPFMSVTSREIDNYIQLRLSGQTGEMFVVRMTLGDAVFQEQFVI